MALFRNSHMPPMSFYYISAKAPPTGDALLKELMQSMRPFQWYKNMVIFIGITFSYNLFNWEMWPRVIFAFIMFCLISGSIYIINDIKDVDRDRLHPKKRFRPIAFGTLSSRTALLVSILLLSVVNLQSAVIYITYSYMLHGV